MRRSIKFHRNVRWVGEPSRYLIIPCFSYLNVNFYLGFLNSLNFKRSYFPPSCLFHTWFDVILCWSELRWVNAAYGCIITSNTQKIQTQTQQIIYSHSYKTLLSQHITLWVTLFVEKHQFCNLEFILYYFPIFKLNGSPIFFT